MALSVTHPFVSAIPDGGDATLVQPSNWNAEHTLTGVASAAQGGTGIAYFAVAGPTAERIYTFPDSAATILYSGGALGTPASGTLTNATGLPEAGLTLADNTTNDFSTTKHGFVPKGTNVGSFLKDDGTWAAPTASATLNGISAATGAATIASGNNTGIVWNWANTTNTTIAFKFGETTAATNGTAQNQVLLQLATLATSTMCPFQIVTRGTTFLSASATASQILFHTISQSAPSLASASVPGSGFDVRTPCVSISTVENTRWAAGIQQSSYAAADTVSYAINLRKSRGTVAGPTVITTGDDLATISGYGYVGATNTYQEACRITFDSTGTISDSATGIGGIMRFAVAKVGAEPAEVLRLTAGTTTGGGWATLNEADASPGTADLADGDEVAVYFKAGNIVFAQNVGGAMKFLFAPVDGATTTWTADGTGP